MLNIIITTIPHDSQRYETCGDWMYNEKLDCLFIYVSELNSPYEEILVGLHEVIEAVLCKQRMILQSSVDKFDIEFENNRKEDDISEPGDDPKAPYHKEHKFATKIEKLLAKELGVDWNKYEKTINNL